MFHLQAARCFIRLVSCALTGGLLLAAGAHAQPVGHWTFNETSGSIATNSAAGANGTLVGNAAFAAGGVAGNCVNFPTHGGGYVTMGNTYAIDVNPEFSVSCWVKTTNTTQPLFAVSRHLTGTLNGYMLGANSFGGGYDNLLKAIYYQNDTPGSMCKGTTTVTDGQWHHLVSVYRFIGTGSIRELWVDGVREASNDFSPGNSRPNPAFMVGGVFFSSGGTTGVYQGQIDEVQVYDYAVSAADIANLRANPASVAAPKQCFCDFNNDGQRNTADLVVFLGAFGSTAGIGSLGDVNYDGAVNTIDLTVFLGRFGQACE